MTIVLIVIGAVLMWAFPNTAHWGNNEINVDLIGKILFWIGVIPTLIGLVFMLLAGLGVIASARPWRGR